MRLKHAPSPQHLMARESRGFKKTAYVPLPWAGMSHCAVAAVPTRPQTRAAGSRVQASPALAPGAISSRGTPLSSCTRGRAGHHAGSQNWWGGGVSSRGRCAPMATVVWRLHQGGLGLHGCPSSRPRPREEVPFSAVGPEGRNRSQRVQMLNRCSKWQVSPVSMSHMPARGFTRRHCVRGKPGRHSETRE